MVVFGLVTPGASLTVAGQAVSVGRDGSFQVEVSLSPGANTIEATARGVTGQQISRTIRVSSLELPSQPFILVITQPENQSIVSEPTVPVRGRTAPDAVVTVNGVGVGVDQVGVFSTSVVLDGGPNVIEVVATSRLGEQLSAVIAVIYRPE